MKLALFLLICVTIAFGQGIFPSIKSVGLATMVDGPETDFAPSDLLAAKIEQVLKIKVVDLDLSVEGFDKIYEGNISSSSIRQIAEKNKVQAVMVGRIRYKFRPSIIVNGGIVCDLAFSYKIIDISGNIVARGVLLEVGPGFSETVAFNVAIDRSVERLANKLNMPI